MAFRRAARMEVFIAAGLCLAPARSDIGHCNRGVVNCQSSLKPFIQFSFAVALKPDAYFYVKNNPGLKPNHTEPL